MIELVKEKFKTNKESFQLYIGSSIISIFNFIVISLLSHFLLPTDYGSFRYILMLVSIAVSIGSLGFAQSIYYFLTKSGSAQEAYDYINALRVGLIASSLLVILGVIIYQNIHLNSNAFLDWDRYSVWIILLIIPAIFQSVELNVFLCMKRVGVYFVNTLSFLSIKIALIIIAYTMKASLIHYVFILSVTGLLPSIFNNYSIQKFFKQEITRFKLELLKGIWSYGLPIGMGLFFGILMSQTDKLVLNFFYNDPISLALVSNGNFEVPLITVFYTSFSAVAFPMMMKAFQENKIDELIKIRNNYQKEVVLILFPIVISLIAWSPSFINLAFGSFYSQSATFFAIYAISFFLRFTSYHDVFLISNKTKYISVIQGFELVFHFGITYIMLYYYGLIGASFAALITNLIYAFFCIYFSKRILNVRMIDIVPFWYLYKIIFISSIIVFPFYFLSMLWDIDILKIVIAFIYVVTCILILYKMESKSKSKLS